MTNPLKIETGQRKTKTTLMVFFSMLGSVLWLGSSGALAGETLVNGLWVPAAMAMTGLGFMGVENLSNAIKRK